MDSVHAFVQLIVRAKKNNWHIGECRAAIERMYAADEGNYKCNEYSFKKRGGSSKVVGLAQIPSPTEKRDLVTEVQSIYNKLNENICDLGK